MFDRLFVALQTLLPQRGLSRWLWHLARLRLGPATTLSIRLFVWAFRIDLGEAALPRARDYPHLNAFFVRALRPDARPLDPRPDRLLSPVDGGVSQIGRLDGARLLQAKGRDYGVVELLGGDPELARPFLDGLFATLYLAPGDYHRIHMPVDGRLRTIVYVPGRLFSVNAATVRGRARLFARNERAILRFETEHGPLALVLVGALFVGGIETRWTGPLLPPHGRRPQRSEHDGQTPLARGEELGRFSLGSTVIVLLPAGAATWSAELAPGSRVRCRAALGVLNGARRT